MNDTENLIHSFNTNKTQNSFSFPQFLIIFIVVLLIGGLTGFTIGKTSKGSTSKSAKTAESEPKKTAGIADKKTFKDKAEGLLREGGVDGEGNFHLERPGGESQNVYLTSTTVDLGEYIGKKVRVWGETFQAEKAGWLMDVGLVELL